MSCIEYFLHVSVAGDGDELHDLRKRSAGDTDLTRAEVEDISDAIGRRFAELNLAAMPAMAPRWG